MKTETPRIKYPTSRANSQSLRPEAGQRARLASTGRSLGSWSLSRGQSPVTASTQAGSEPNLTDDESPGPCDGPERGQPSSLSENPTNSASGAEG